MTKFKLWWIPILILVFLLSFLGTTIISSVLIPLDEAPICFKWEGNCTPFGE